MARREATLERVRAAIARLNAADTQLASAETRIRTMTTAGSRMSEQLAGYRSSLAELRQSFEAREAELVAQNASLSAKVDTLTAVASALQDTVSHLVDESNTAYVAMGTKEDLIHRGVLVNEGSRFLFFGSRRLEPARDLDPAQFQRIDIRQSTVITLPDGDRRYRIVSRHSPLFLDSTMVENGRAHGELRITDPERFWSPSRFLILVRN